MTAPSDPRSAAPAAAANLHRQEEGRGALLPAFTPVVDLERAFVVGYEVLLGLSGDAAGTPRDWVRRGPQGETSATEARLLTSALAARTSLPAGATMIVSLSAPGAMSAEVAEAITAAGRLDQVVVAVRCDPGVDLGGLRMATASIRDKGAALMVDAGDVDYSALRQIVRLRPQLVRVGPDFVEDVAGDPARSAVVETLAALARRIGARLLADGIAWDTELGPLIRMGASLASGPLFGERLDAATPPKPELLAGLRPAWKGDRGTLAPLIDPAPTLPAGSGLEDLADTFLGDPHAHFIVLVDDHARPVRLVERVALLRAEPYEREVLAMSSGTPVQAAARRATGRPAGERLVPIVCLDSRNRHIGVVHVDRLLEALATQD